MNRLKLSIAILSLILLPLFSGYSVAQSSRYWDESTSRVQRVQVQRVQDVADQLSRRAQHVMEEIGNNYDYNVDLPTAQLYRTLRNFVDTTRAFRNRASQGIDMSRDARRIVRMADRIDQLIQQSFVSDHLMDDWAAAQDRVAMLAGMFNLDYSSSRELARSDYGGDRHAWNYGSTGRGYLRWQGYVDGLDIIRVQSNRVMINHLQSRPIRDALFDMNSPLPRAPVAVNLGNVQGRGIVELIEQPNASNGYTAAVRINDAAGGDSFYSFELRW